VEYYAASFVVTNVIGQPDRGAHGKTVTVETLPASYKEPLDRRDIRF